MSERQLVGLKAAGKILSIGETKIRAIACQDPTFPAYLIGRRWKVDASRLEDWIEAQRVGAGAIARDDSRPARRGRPPAPVAKQEWKAITPGWSRDGKRPAGKQERGGQR